jgi:hypothetical protein
MLLQSGTSPHPGIESLIEVKVSVGELFGEWHPSPGFSPG